MNDATDEKMCQALLLVDNDARPSLAKSSAAMKCATPTAAPDCEAIWFACAAAARLTAVRAPDAESVPGPAPDGDARHRPGRGPPPEALPPTGPLLTLLPAGPSRWRSG